MRVYALLLGVVFTTAYGFAAQVAVSSVSAGRHAAAGPAAPSAAGAPLDRVWYGGFIDPITVESTADAARATLTKSGLLDRPTLRCTETAETRYHAIS